MNERIKQLLEQSGLQPYYDAQEGHIEKFAELLIKECGQWFNNRLVVEPDHGLPHRIERNRAVVSVMKEYNTYFGVEE
jgi:hypothetical protein